MASSIPTNPRNNLRRVLSLALVVMALVAATLFSPGLTSRAEATAVARATSVQLTPADVDTFAIDHHPNGSQMIVRSVEHTDDVTSVHVQIINGRDFDTRFNPDTRDTFIVDDNNRVHELLEAEQLSLGVAETSTMRLNFPAVDGSVESISLHFEDPDNDTQDPNEGSPSFVIEDIDLTRDIDEPELPQEIEFEEDEERQVHPNGSIFHVEAIRFEDNRTDVDFRAANGGDVRVAVTSGRHVSFLEDDLGNRYFIKLNDGELNLRVEEGRQISGTVIFAGRIHPDAETVRLVLNNDESATSPNEFDPKFELGPWDVSTGDSLTEMGPGLLPLQIDETQEHQSEVVVTLEMIEFNDTGSLVHFDAQNQREILTTFLNGCCDSLYLEDDLGNRYVAERDDDNSNLRISAGAGIEGTLFFPGEIDEDATTLTLAINDRDEDLLDEPDTNFPEFVFGPYELERAEVEAPGSIGEFLEAFGAEETEDGINFTIPLGALFETQTELDEDTEILGRLVEIIDIYGADVEIQVHTDSRGTAYSNLLLTREQADLLVEALEDFGIDSDSIDAIGRGEEVALESNRTSEGRLANQRVEFTILTDEGLLD